MPNFAEKRESCGCFTKNCRNWNFVSRPSGRVLARPGSLAQSTRRRVLFTGYSNFYPNFIKLSLELCLEFILGFIRVSLCYLLGDHCLTHTLSHYKFKDSLYILFVFSIIVKNLLNPLPIDVGLIGLNYVNSCIVLV